MATANKLTVAALKSLRDGYHNDGGNLYFQVSGQAARSWVFRYLSPTLRSTTGGRKAREAGLGPYPDITLAKARDIALDWRRMLLDGKDPIEERNRKRVAAVVEAAKSKTFDQVFVEYLNVQRPTWKDDEHEMFLRATVARYASPIIGRTPVRDIDLHAIRAVLDPIWQTRTNTARKLRGFMESVLGLAAVLGYRQGDNPAKWKGNLEHALADPNAIAPVKHQPSLHYSKAAGFVRDLCEHEGVAPLALEFLMLTALRTDAVLGARWDEVDLDAKTWTVPASRNKGRKGAARSHVVPLSSRALEILEEMRGLGTKGHVFPGRGDKKPPGESSMLSLLGRMGLTGKVTPHGMRSTFAEWASEETDSPRELIQMALAHTVSDQVERAYFRGDLRGKRAELMQAWSDFITATSKVAA